MENLKRLKTCTPKEREAAYTLRMQHAKPLSCGWYLERVRSGQHLTADEMADVIEHARYIPRVLRQYIAGRMSGAVKLPKGRKPRYASIRERVSDKRLNQEYLALRRKGASATAARGQLADKYHKSVRTITRHLTKIG